jgi:hypothetical protein
MMNFNVNEEGYDLPDYLSIENYVKIFKVKDMFSDQYYAVKLINLITGAPVELLMKQDYEQINYVAAYILSLLPMEEKPKFYDRFELDGVHYGFFPNWRDLTFAEFVDMDTISTKPMTELLDLLHVLAAIMYRPIEHEITEHNFLIEEYDVKTMKQRAELFKKKLDMKYVLGAQTFFFQFVKRYSLYSQVSSIQKIGMWTKMKIMWKLRKAMWRTASKKHTDGSLSSTELLETILQNTTKSTKKI